MSVNDDIVRDMAALARLNVPEEDLGELAKQMHTILEYMGEISSWEGASDLERPDAVRRPDVALPCPDPSLAGYAAEVDGTSVVVPPVKGAS